jgi:hypothetical protein
MDIEEQVVSFLVTRGFVASTDVPNPRPAKFVTVERTGGGRDNIVVDRPTVAIQSWAKTRKEAADQAYGIDAIIPDMVEIEDISRVERNSFYNFPDETGNNARYQIVVDFVTI